MKGAAGRHLGRAQGCPGKILRLNNQANRSADFVLQILKLMCKSGLSAAERFSGVARVSDRERDQGDRDAHMFNCSSTIVCVIALSVGRANQAPGSE
jgi:hypothetical protein